MSKQLETTVLPAYNGSNDKKDLRVRIYDSNGNTIITMERPIFLKLFGKVPKRGYNVIYNYSIEKVKKAKP